MINELIKLANALDDAGFEKEADQVDLLVKKAIALAVPMLPIVLKAIAATATATIMAAGTAWVISQLFIRYYNESEEKSPIDRARSAYERIAATDESEYPSEEELKNAVPEGKVPSKEDVGVGLRDIMKFLPEIGIQLTESTDENPQETLEFTAILTVDMDLGVPYYDLYQGDGKHPLHIRHKSVFDAKNLSIDTTNFIREEIARGYPNGDWPAVGRVKIEKGDVGKGITAAQVCTAVGHMLGSGDDAKAFLVHDLSSGVQLVGSTVDDLGKTILQHPNYSGRPDGSQFLSAFGGSANTISGTCGMTELLDW